ncbi:MAG: diguanylate cyclase [Actinobacteria bacterium]|nr:diguanylate cyclase [Actinomycetota bacterium]
MYSHDGIRDSLTNLAAPPLFYQDLRRELARKNRNGGEILLLRLVLREKMLGEEFGSEYEKDILEFGHALTAISRSEDLCARLGEFEFVLLFSGEEVSAQGFTSRLERHWHLKERKLFIFSSSIVSCENETGLELLNRLDHEVLVESTL